MLQLSNFQTRIANCSIAQPRSLFSFHSRLDYGTMEHLFGDLLNLSIINQ